MNDRYPKRIDSRNGDDGDTPQELMPHLASIKQSETKITQNTKEGPLDFIPKPVESTLISKNSAQYRPPVYFDVNTVKPLIQADPSTWKFELQDKSFKVYSNFKDHWVRGMALGSIADGDAEIMFQMEFNPEIRVQWDKTYCKIKQLQILSDKEDLVYFEMKLPFPFSNRDLVMSRYYLNSDKDSEEIERLGFPKTNNKRWVLMMHSVVLKEHPPMKGLERAENITVLSWEEDGENPKTVYSKSVSFSDLKGHLPVKMVQKGVPKQFGKSSNNFVDEFRKNRVQWAKLITK